MSWLVTGALVAGYVVGAVVCGRALADRDGPALLAGGALSGCCMAALLIRLIRSVLS